jgi:hypothetical protein
MAASASTLTLIKGALKFMAWIKIKTAAVIGACVLAAGTTILTVNCLLDRSIREMPPGWSAFAGDINEWHWAAGKINAHNDSGDGLLLSGKDYGDFTMSVVASVNNREASVAFRMQDKDNGYILVFCPAGTHWTQGNAAQLRLMKRTIEGEFELATYKGEKFAALGRKAKIEVTASGPSFTVRLNGVKVLRDRDDTYATGRLGFRICGDSTDPSDATFSKLIINVKR